MKKLYLLFAAFCCFMSVGAKTIYFKPNANWLQGDAKFAIFRDEAPNNTWSTFMTKVEGTIDVYAATVGDDWTTIKLVRFSPAATETGWFWDESNKLTWNVTQKITIPTDGQNALALTAGTWSDAGGVWTTYTPGSTNVELNYYLVGYINHSDNYNNDYPFANGKFTATFTEDSYVIVKDQTGACYLTENSENATADLPKTFTLDKTKGEKIMVAKGVELTFTVVENADCTLTFTVAKAGEVSALESVENKTVKAVKIIENGQIYILRDGVRYNVLGAQVK